jgi:hypothetical protein
MRPSKAATRCALMSHPTFRPMIRQFQRDTGGAVQVEGPQVDPRLTPG